MGKTRRINLGLAAGLLVVVGVMAENTAFELPDELEYGALFELETGHSAGRTETTMATVELSAGWQAIDWLRGDVVFLYEENDTDPMNLDQLFFTFGNTDEFPFYLQGGQFYVPFGNLESFFISDPVLLELSESLRQGAMLGFEKGGFHASVTVFETDIHGTESHNGVLAVSYEAERDDASIAVGGSLIYNMLDADGLTGVLVDDLGYTFADESAGWDVWLTASKGRATLIAEVVQALDTLDVDGADTGLKPAAMNLELGYDVTDALCVAVKMERAEDVDAWFAEQRYGAVASCTVFEHEWICAGVGVEYMHEEVDDGTDGDIFTMQFSMEF